MAVTFTLTIDELRFAVGAGSSADETTRLTQLKTAAEAQISKFLGSVSTVPAAIVNEATIRIVGYLIDSRPDNVTSETVGQVTRRYAASRQSAFRHSGAQNLLARYKRRRGGKCVS